MVALGMRDVDRKEDYPLLTAVEDNLQRRKESLAVEPRPSG
jgi:hypothetical protein